MSNETPNRVHAGGTFVGTAVVGPPFTTRIINQKGILAVNRLGVGQYEVVLQRALAFAEGFAHPALPANFQATAGAQIAPDGLSVLVTVLALGSGAPTDPPVLGVTVWSVSEGEGSGPSIALPPVPPPLPPSPGARFAWFDPQKDSNLGNYRTQQLSGIANFNFSFVVPDDFGALTSLDLICSPVADIVAGDIDLSSDYGAEGESVTNTQETDTTTTYNLTTGIWNALDISTVFTAIAAGDFCGVNVDNNGLGTSVDYLGIRMRYMTP